MTLRWWVNSETLCTGDVPIERRSCQQPGWINDGATESLPRDTAELLHLREHVDDAPGLGDSAAGEPSATNRASPSSRAGTRHPLTISSLRGEIIPSGLHVNPSSRCRAVVTATISRCPPAW